MKHSILFAALLLAAGVAQAGDRTHISTHSCNVDSRYSLSTYRSAFVLSRDKGGTPARITIGGGKLFIDGREAELSADDRQRVGQFEGELRQLMPQVQKVTSEAIDIAFTALVEVARGMSGSPDATVAKLEKSHMQALKEINSRPSILFSRDDHADAVGKIIQPILSDYVPEITGSAVTLAMKAVFASDAERKAIEARMDKMSNELDTRVNARAEALEPLADAMCDRMRHMDQIDNAITYRLPSGQPLELLSVDSKETKKEAP
ncbi:MAG TPA: DUF2884 family protein [Arenimonas sp.]|uniref:DUF2884 family protein n=1 Tax=Arenimonas sp. TaxID=1872635 RepID=UPI002C1E0937|nr:DUF2884 family protein [Arenimonas sp.]HMB57558.1 DUF2884 family protein [Arenimonas sp.]